MVLLNFITDYVLYHVYCYFDQTISFSAPTLSEDEDEEGGIDNTLAWDDSSIHVASGSTPVSGSFVPAIGGPFSALTPSMWPQDILSRIQQVRISFIKYIVMYFMT